MQNAALFVASVLIWGSSWIAISAHVGPVPPLVSVFYRFAVASLILIGILGAARRLSMPALRHHPFILAQAICIFSMNFICFYSSAAYIPSGLNSVIFSLATIFNAVAARFFFGERIAGRTLLAGALGAAGVLLLFSHEILVELDLPTLKGIGLAVLGTIFFSLGNMASRRNSAAGIRPAIANAWGMAYGALFLLAAIGVTRTPFVAPPDGRYLAAMLYLAVVGSVLGFTAYLGLVARIGTSKAAYTTVLFPIVALGLSTLFEGYRWTPAGGVGLVLTLFGNLVMFSRRAPR